MWNWKKKYLEYVQNYTEKILKDCNDTVCHEQ